MTVSETRRSVTYNFQGAPDDGVLRFVLVAPDYYYTEAHVDAAMAAFAESLHANYPELTSVVKVYEIDGTESVPVYTAPAQP